MLLTTLGHLFVHADKRYCLFCSLTTRLKPILFCEMVRRHQILVPTCDYVADARMRGMHCNTSFGLESKHTSFHSVECEKAAVPIRDRICPPTYGNRQKML